MEKEKRKELFTDELEALHTEQGITVLLNDGVISGFNPKQTDILAEQEQQRRESWKEWSKACV